MAAVIAPATVENHVFPLAAVSLFAKKPHQGHQPSSTTFRLGITLAISNTATGMPVCMYDSGTRPRCTGKERDTETGGSATQGLDYFGARYFSSAQGRFTSPDEFKGGIVDPVSGKDIETNAALPYADITDPQTLNKYAYVRNNPLRFVDPDGHDLAGAVAAVDVAIKEVDKVVQPLIDSAGTVASRGGSIVIGGAVRGLGLVAGLLLSPVSLGGQDEVRFEREQQQREQQYEQQQQQHNPGEVTPALPDPTDAGHKKGARRSTKDDHERKRPGASPPPNYVPDREFVQPKEKKSNRPAPDKTHKNKYKKETNDATP